MLYLFLFLSLFGLAGMTWLFPCLARIAWELKKAGQMTDWLAYNFHSQPLPKKIVILIPAHNEQKNIQTTLDSIKKAVAEAKNKFSDLKVTTIVGADGCSDLTATRSREKSVQVYEAKRQGKWKTITSLVRQAPKADWVILADAGVTWPKNFLRDAMLYLSDPLLLGLAPSYRNPHAGMAEHIAWSLEQKLKSLEVSAGGPVSVHGATSIYRYRELLETVNSLDGESWINDDVVLPLVMRTRYPDRHIMYATDLYIYESENSSGTKLSFQQHLKRRIRMLKGNTQWIQQLLPSIWKENQLSAILAFRRIFRILWSYWALAMVSSIGVILGIPFTTVFLTLLLLLFVTILLSFTRLNILDSVSGALTASLLAPWYLLKQQPNMSIQWR